MNSPSVAVRHLPNGACMDTEDDLVTSVIIGASSVGQLADNLKAIDNTAFSAEELKNIYQIVK